MKFYRERLKALRQARGYSLQQMARLLRMRTGLKVSYQSIWYWEAGINLPSLESLMALAKFFNEKIERFFK